MTLPSTVFPASLPRPDGPPYSFSIRRNLEITDIPRAKTQRRVINRNVRSVFNLQWSLTKAELATFYTFANEHGYHWFQLELPSTLTMSGQVSATRVRLNSDIQVAAAGYDRFTVSCTAELWDVSVPALGPYQVVIDNYGQEALLIACDDPVKSFDRILFNCVAPSFTT